MPPLTNLLANLPDEFPDELFQSLVDTPHVRIERIVSRGHASPEGFWYDQPDDEWVLVLQGHATVEFEGEEPFDMHPGDAVFIPTRRRHRVVSTSKTEHTVWLAVHIKRNT